MKVEPITTLNIDGKIHVVSELPQTVRNMVSLLDAWRQKEVDMRDDLTLVQLAQQRLTQEIMTAIQATQQAARQPAPAPTETPVEDAVVTKDESKNA